MKFAVAESRCAERARLSPGDGIRRSVHEQQAIAASLLDLGPACCLSSDVRYESERPTAHQAAMSADERYYRSPGDGRQVGEHARTLRGIFAGMANFQ
jgi:hypothetical protein